MAVHEGIKKYKCDQCDLRTTSSNNLKRHIMSVHEGLRSHQCEKCGNSFSSPATLRKHIITVHEGLKNFQVCIQQALQYLSKNYLDLRY